MLNFKKINLSFIMIFILLSFSTLLFGNNNPQLEKNRLVSNLSFYSATSDKVVKLSDLRGKNVLINFTATWCPYCMEEKKAFQKEWESSLKNREDLEVLIVFGPYGAIEKQDNIEKIKNYMKSNNHTYPVYFDKDKSILKEFAVSSVPTSILLDKDGKIVESNSEYYKLNFFKKNSIMIQTKSN